MSAIINLNGADPTASAGKVLGVWQKDPTPGGIDPTTGYPYYNVSVEVPNPVGIVGITIDGGGSVPTTGIKGFIQCPYSGTITGWAIVADQSGSASLDIWKASSSAPPSAPTIPTSANKISASAPVALSDRKSVV